QMEAEHIQEINNINAQISQMKSNHELVLQKLEATYNEKLIAEYEKFVSYENKMNRMLADVNMRYTELQKAKDESEATITEDYEIKLQEAKLLYDENVQINEMVRELENLQKVILGLDLQLGELKEKLAASSNEVRKEIDKNRRMKKSLQDIRVDIHHASGYIQNVPMLQKSVKATKNTSLLSYDKVRLVDENAALLEETNQLRKNLVSEVTLNRKLNSLIGMSRVTPQQAQQKVNFATATNKDIHKQYTEQLE
uniref:Structural maintenance of chromosomes protein 3 homolog n=1 Tax=Diabrotica virgifera virgifera TaxID=50390 RepID=A0A6P7H3L8_DIAVI